MSKWDRAFNVIRRPQLKSIYCGMERLVVFRLPGVFYVSMIYLSKCSIFWNIQFAATFAVCHCDYSAALCSYMSNLVLSLHNFACNTSTCSRDYRCLNSTYIRFVSIFFQTCQLHVQVPGFSEELSL